MKGLHSGLFAIICTALFISGCDVSEGGGGSGQAPDPVVVDFPIAYIERPLPVDENGEDVPNNILDPRAFNGGAKLILKDRASVPADATVITDIAFAVEPTPDPDNPDAEQTAIVPPYDVKDLEVSADGTKLIFAMRAPEIENADEDEQPTWNIWEYDLETEILRRIIASDLIAEEGQDVSPVYLPDGRILFSSTRQRRSRAVLLDENKPQFSALTEDGDSEAFVLHVMDEDGANIKQITYNQSHDLQPTVLSNGEILFLRWDNYRNRKDRLSLYKSNPDGSNMSFLYGYHSQLTGTNDSEGAFVNPRELSDGRIMVNLRPRESLLLGGDLVGIDVATYSEINVAADNSGATGPAQESVSPGKVIATDGSPSLDGYYSSAYPIEDGTNRVLMSWSPCLVDGLALGVYVNANLELIGDEGQYVTRSGSNLNEASNPVVVNQREIGAYPCSETNINLRGIQAARPRYGVWVYDPQTDTQSPVVLAEESKMFTEAVVLESRTLPDFIADPIPGIDFDAELDSENVGILHIRSVYDVDGSDISPNGIAATSDPLQTSPEQRPARFLRILKAVSRPDDDILDIDEGDYGNISRMRDILGYVPIEPDGSAMFKIPADVAITFSIVNASGKRISPAGDAGSEHENWITLRAGEVRECTGCHADEDSQVPHGRLGSGPATINAGALADAAFPNTSLRDDLGSLHTITPTVGETMAQYYSRLNGPRTPSMNAIDMNDWSDDGVRPRTALISLSYADLVSGAPPTECLTDWNSLCRSVINYVEHIQPIWDASRQITDQNDTLIADNTCTSCHSAVDAMGAPQVPAGNLQIDLSSTQSTVNPAHITSYDELFRATPVVELNANGLLQPQTEQLVVDGVPQFEMEQLTVNGVLQYEATDASSNIVPAPSSNTDPNLTLRQDSNGFLIPYNVQVLDAMNQPIPILVPTGNTIGPVMNRNGAINNDTFFDIFEVGGGAVDHSGFLNGAELKLIAEWLDIGGQYYNNPFDAPEN